MMATLTNSSQQHNQNHRHHYNNQTTTANAAAAAASTSTASLRNSAKKSVRMCQVCFQNPIRCIRYGAQCCNSCANFFLKYEQNKPDRLVFCSCHNNRVTKCSKCKYERCLSVGMRMRHSLQQPTKSSATAAQPVSTINRNVNHHSTKTTTMTTMKQEAATGITDDDDDEYVEFNFNNNSSNNSSRMLPAASTTAAANNTNGFNSSSNNNNSSVENVEEFRSIEIVLNRENAAKLAHELQCKIQKAASTDTDDIKFTFYL